MTPTILLIVFALLAFLLVLGFVLILLTAFRRKQKSVVRNTSDEKLIGLASLQISRRAPQVPPLKVLGMDGTLAVLVLAPRGNSVEFPPADQLHSLVDRIVPGFSKILDTHQPIFRRWDPQMSFEGFTHAFAYNVTLPGDKGKGTNWVSICGKLAIPSGQLFVGLACHADQPNEMGQLVVEHEGKWSEFIRAN